MNGWTKTTNGKIQHFKNKKDWDNEDGDVYEEKKSHRLLITRK